MKRIILLALLAININLNAQCWQKISVNNSFTHAIKYDGTLWAWGSNSSGQLGDGSNINRDTPVNIGNNSTWTAVSGGTRITVGIKSDGSLWTWGQLFGGSNPVRVGTDTDWVKISAGSSHILAIKSNSTLWSFGLNNKGQLGINSIIDNYTPTQVGTDTDWQSISGGGYHSAAIKNNGTLWTWGDNTSKQLGDGGVTNYRTVPYQVGTGTNWLTISCGGGSASVLAMKTDHTIWGWGNNTFGGLGVGSTTDRNFPTQIGTQNDWQSIQTGFLHTVAIKNNGTLWACGYNASGRLGDGTTVQKTTLIQIGTDTNWQEAYGGGDHTIAKKIGGSTFSWGNNVNGQLGNGTFTAQNVPGQTALCTDLGQAEFISRTISIYPNPSDDIINIVTPDNAFIHKVIITDMLGKKVRELNGSLSEIAVQDLANGLYAIQVIADSGTYHSKFIKQ